MVSENKENVNDEAGIYSRFGIAPGNEALPEEDFVYLTIDSEGEFHSVSLENLQDELDSHFVVEASGNSVSALKAPKKDDRFPTIEQVKAVQKNRTEQSKAAERAQKEVDKQAQATEKAAKKIAEAETQARLKAKEKADKEEIKREEKHQKLMAQQQAGTDPTPELEYARDLSTNTNLAAQVLDENVAMYEWQSSYWAEVSKHMGRSRAFAWLEVNFPHMTGNKLAQNAYESALFKLQSLPPQPSENIIPLTNVWLFVDDSGKLQIKEPSKAWGVTYTINAALKFNLEDEFYTPAPLQDDCMFARYIKSSLPDEKERDLVQEYSGYTLINSVKHQVAQIWEGGGSNGKSILLYLLEQLHKKTIAVDLDELEGFNLEPFRDASLAISAETPKGKLNENVLKKFIAGDLVKLRGMYKAPFSCHPKAKWIMSCNRFPRINDESDGVFRRLQYIRWNVQFKGDQIIPELEKLIAESELAIVLDWCLTGLVRLLERGKFAPPESVLARLQEEKISSNSVHAFIHEFEYRADPLAAGILNADFLKKYEDFCEESSLVSFGGVEFWKRIRTLFPDLRVSQKRVAGKVTRFVHVTTQSLAEEKEEQKQIDSELGQSS